MKIFIAVPNMGSIVPDLVKRLIHWSREAIVGQVYMPEGIQPMDNMRNQVVRKFLESDCTHLFWVDSDVVPPFEALDKLAAHDLPAVTGVCFCMRTDDKGSYFPYPVIFKLNFDLNGYQIHYGSGLEKIDACGGGCLLVAREVYEAIGPRPYEFIYDNNGNLALTCDFYIWGKVRDAGYDLYCDHTVICDHQRKCSIKGFQDLLAMVT